MSQAEAQSQYSSIMISIHGTAAKAIAVTFDDGPNPEFTPQMLDIFREEGGRATFYMTGDQIARYPDTARLVQAEGHEIGNHSYTHPNLTELDEGAVRAELVRTGDLIRETVGVQPATFRPPYLATDAKVERIARELGYAVIGGVNGAARDWEMPGADHILEVSLAVAKPGSFLLFHDGYGDRSQTVEAVRVLVKTLKKEGYMFVTASELLAMK
ncbi:Peptidoglycan/xylan/chitin deacetylase, PgdA/CDA1 family [Cohnella sp. OV330]|uniref:polysaccharide deacetylase family protein n=1 Tax=Cohnella sp. OV330 TaxID=1855288 RepID=UPI0008F3760D|nr:polysaccharide deacetylase family protein [Cohnella sp. OV330]SFB61806.1 Peptidoglycan/xylan/chitin deacetylase, PgdA/CDA1 family [Cohnella sp. OV330]